MSKKDLTIIQMNDTHGYINEHYEYIWNGDKEDFKIVGGYPRIKGYVEEVRKEKNDNVLFLDNGDTFHGTYHVVKSKGEVVVPLLNNLDLHVMTAHWEFAYGPEQFMHLTKEINHPMLAINCYNKDNDELIFDPYILKEINGLKIGVIGIAANIIDKVMPEHFSEGVYFTNGEEELPKYIKELREEEDVDLIVLLSHLGFPQEIELAENINGIDVLLSGQTHNRLFKPHIVNDTIIIQSGCHGSFLGRLDLEIEDKKIVDYKHELVLLDDKIEKDKEMEDILDKILEKDKEILEEKVGETLTDLARDRVLESTMDNLLLQSIMYHEKDAVAAFSKKPFNQMGGYVKRCLGLNLYFKIENPKGHRIQELFIDGKAIEKNKTYKTVYVTSQGVPNKYGSNRKHLDIHAVEAVKNYIKDKGKVKADLKGTIMPI